MAPPAAETLQPNPNDNRTLRLCGKTTPNLSQILRAYSVCRIPSPWTPEDSSTDPERESKLLRLMQSSIRQFDNSRFGRRFLSRVRDPQIQARFHELTASCSQIQIVAYGIGSIESDGEIPRLQVALALRLKEELGATAAGPIEVFDPVLSAAECAVLVSLGCTVITYNECCRREATAPTIFYMPHCEAVLYENLLRANWKPEMLRRMVVLGNSFGYYDWFVNVMRSVAFRVGWRHLLGIRRYVLEVEMEDWCNTRILEENEDEIEIYKGFLDMSWHFFELDSDTDLDCLLNEFVGKLLLFLN
ncbi:Protein SENSITIVITY TO RED LIGHT REDUCED 1 [Platanthera guangdongensis]|uniref:Protein SENSITIVITY TO RED LIGHT REDUCED 1 n=1 Tax=Platanthera guangdongensis TaxID=2320717 RepID=A0ABR2LW87_9ASPA